MAYKGILIPIGGNEDKGSDIGDDGLDFLTEGILSQVVAESGGLEASILVITTASKIPVEVGENYISAFNLLGCSNIEILDIRNSRSRVYLEVSSWTCGVYYQDLLGNFLKYFGILMDELVALLF